MSQLDSYLFFDGTCADAMRFYERTLGGKIQMMMTHAESPEADKMPKGSENRILHASLLLGDRVLMASDSMVGQPYEGMKGFSLSLSYPTVAEAKKTFDALAAGGQVRDAVSENLLVRGVRHAGRPLRHAVDGQRPRGENVSLRKQSTQRERC